MNIWEREKFYNADTYTPLLVDRDVLNILYKIAHSAKDLAADIQLTRSETIWSYEEQRLIEAIEESNIVEQQKSEGV